MDVICVGARCEVDGSHDIFIGDEEEILNFSFNSEWNTLEKQVYFYQNGIEYVVPLFGATCSIPSPILQEVGHLYIGVIGTLPDLDNEFPDRTKRLPTNRTYVCSIRLPIVFD